MFAYMSIAVATNYCVILKMNATNVFNLYVADGIYLLVQVLVIPLTLLASLNLLMKDLNKFRQFDHDDDVPSSVHQVLDLIEPLFAIRYGQKFAAAEIEIWQLAKLTTDQMLKMDIPLGHAMCMQDGFRRCKLPSPPFLRSGKGNERESGSRL